jgi:uncharacterized membrane protein
VISLVIAAAFFVGIHLFISGTQLRTAIVAKTGENAFRGLFSLVSIAGLVWLGSAYARADTVHLWARVEVFGLLALVLTFFAFLFVTLGITTPSPTAVGGEATLRGNVAPKGIQRITRHPFLWGVAMWALAHLLVNGDLASLIFFGSLMLLAMIGPPSIDAKRARAFGEQWKGFAEASSNVPFLAILQGRNTLKIAEIGAWRLLVALLLFGVFLATHARLFGVSPFSG